MIVVSRITFYRGEYSWCPMFCCDDLIDLVDFRTIVTHNKRLVLTRHIHRGDYYSWEQHTHWDL